MTPVASGTGIEYFTLRYDFTITAVWFETAAQAPTGSAAVARVLNNQTGSYVNIFTAEGIPGSEDSLTVPINGLSIGPLVPNITELPAGTSLRFDIQQTGSVNTGLGYRVTLQGTRS